MILPIAPPRTRYSKHLRTYSHASRASINAVERSEGHVFTRAASHSRPHLAAPPHLAPPPCGLNPIPARLHPTHLRPNPPRRHSRLRPDLVEARRNLRDLPPQLSGLERRRHRRPQRHHFAPRLSPDPRRRRHLDRPHVP